MVGTTLSPKYGKLDHTFWRFDNDLYGPWMLYAMDRAELVTWHITPPGYERFGMRKGYADQPSIGGTLGKRYDFDTPLEWQLAWDEMKAEIKRGLEDSIERSLEIKRQQNQEAT